MHVALTGQPSRLPTNEYRRENSALFPSLQALFPHQSSQSHTVEMAYCYRCERPFRTLLALNQHTYDSSKHHMCPECTGDFKTLYELREHLVDEHDGCPECYDIFDSESDLQDHLFEEHNMCSICNQFFKSPSNLKYVSSFHIPGYVSRGKPNIDDCAPN